MSIANDMNFWQNDWGGGEKQEECLKNMGHALPLKAIDLPETNMNVDVSKNRVPKIERIIIVSDILIGVMHAVLLWYTVDRISDVALP